MRYTTPGGIDYDASDLHEARTFFAPDNPLREHKALLVATIIDQQRVVVQLREELDDRDARITALQEAVRLERLRCDAAERVIDDLVTAAHAEIEGDDPAVDPRGPGGLRPAVPVEGDE